MPLPRSALRNLSFGTFRCHLRGRSWDDVGKVGGRVSGDLEVVVVELEKSLLERSVRSIYVTY